MSTATPPIPSVSTGANLGPAGSLIDQRLNEACRALWWAELTRACLGTFIGALGATLLWVVVDHWIWSPPTWMRVLVWTALAGWVAMRLISRVYPLIGKSINPEYAARSLEHDLPNAKQQLTSYVTLKDDSVAGGLRGRVIRTIGSSVAGKLKKHDALPQEATGTMKWWMAAVGTLVLVLAYAALSPKNTFASAKRLFVPLAPIEAPTRAEIIDVQPGDTEIIAGRTLEVSAKVEGLREGDEVAIEWTSGTQSHTVPLVLDAESGQYVGNLKVDHSATGHLEYRVTAADDEAGPFVLRIKNLPVVALQSVRYQPPSYTGDVPHTSGSGSITAVDGTQITIRAKTNRPVKRATIEFNPKALGDQIRPTAGTRPMQLDETATGLSATFALRSAVTRSSTVEYESYRIRVWDDADQSNPEPIVYPIRVVADLAPEISIVTPRESPKEVPVNSQQIIEVHAMDPDFGLKEVRLQIRRGSLTLSEPILWADDQGAKGNQVTEYRFRPGELGLLVGDKIEVTAFATDNRRSESDPAIKPNRTKTDAVELRIVASESLPPRPDGNDGISEPDSRPPADPLGDQQSQADSKTDDTAQGQSQGGSSDQSGSSKSGGSGGEESGAGASSGGDPSDSKGEGGTDSAQSQSDGSDNQDSAEPSGSGSKNGGAGQQTSDNRGGEQQAPQDSSSGGAQGDPGKQTGSGQAGSEQGSRHTEQQPAANQDPSLQGNEPPNQDPDENTGSAGKQGSPAGDQGASSSQQSTDGGDESPQSPDHDGKAFERMLDHIKDRQKQNRGSEGEGDKQNKPNGDTENGSQQNTPDKSADGSSAGSSQPDSSTDSGDSGTERATDQPQDGKSGGDPKGGDQRPKIQKTVPIKTQVGLKALPQMVRRMALAIAKRRVAKASRSRLIAVHQRPEIPHRSGAAAIRNQ